MLDIKMDMKAKEALEILEKYGPDSQNWKLYGQHGLDKGLYTQDEVDERIERFNLSKGVE